MVGAGRLSTPPEPTPLHTSGPTRLAWRDFPIRAREKAPDRLHQVMGIWYVWAEGGGKTAHRRQ